MRSTGDSKLHPPDVAQTALTRSREQLLSDFVLWSKQHITGDEKGEAQTFIDHLIRAFGEPGSREVGGTFEVRVKRAAIEGKAGSTTFADYVWPGVVLIEMKKRGEDLSRHYRQAFDYWTRLVPGRPRYVVLCNFDEFQVYDFDTQLDTPKDTVKLEDLPTRWGPLAFLFPTNESPTFENDREAVTREAADALARCFTKLEQRKEDRRAAQRFILQMLVALFAEDIGLLPKYIVGKLLDECKEPSETFDLLGGLFAAMNTPGGTTGGRYKGVRYFNGGLFAEPARLELHEDEVNQLKAAAKADWSKVSPEIFGTLFEHSLGKEERHAYGAHFTSPVDIMKIVNPTIAEPWRLEIESAKSAKRLEQLLERLTTLRVLDPACGSGNFLYLAYREMKRLESRIRERLTTEFPGAQPKLIHVNARQFFGLDINEFAIELAKVTMMIARKLAVDELHISDEAALPLDNLDENIRAADALFTDWPKVDVIIGNPPFLGSRYLAEERGYEYANGVYEAFPTTSRMADYCVYWFRRAQENLPEGGRAGLVGTHNIRTGGTRESGLDYILATGGTITEAIASQPWSGEAAVDVSIVNWIKGESPGIKRLFIPVGTGSTETIAVEVKTINSALSPRFDVKDARELSINKDPKGCYVGQYPFNEGFLLSPAEASSLIAQNNKLSEVIFPYMIGRDLVTLRKPSRWAIDFGKRNMIDAASYPEAFERVKRSVMPDVIAQAKREKELTGKESTRWTRVAERWWQFRDYQPGTMAVLKRVPRYISCSRVTKRPIFEFISAKIHPDNTLIVFPFADDYTFGVLQSSPHWTWFQARCSMLGGRYRYTSETVFDTFPWPQSPSHSAILKVATAAREVRRIRGDALTKIKGGLRAVYRLLELPGKSPLKDAHSELDSAVIEAYGFSRTEDLLSQLLGLNFYVAQKIEVGEAVTLPGVPAGQNELDGLISEDCIEP